MAWIRDVLNGRAPRGRDYHEQAISRRLRELREMRSTEPVGYTVFVCCGYCKYRTLTLKGMVEHRSSCPAWRRFWADCYRSEQDDERHDPLSCNVGDL